MIKKKLENKNFTFRPQVRKRVVNFNLYLLFPWDESIVSSVWQIQRNFLFFFSRVFVWIQVENIILENIHVSMSSINNRTCEWMKRRDFFQKLTNAQLTITDVMWMLLARIPWAHTNVLAKLDILEMAANALVSSEDCF